MPTITFHYNNSLCFRKPQLCIIYPSIGEYIVNPAAVDDFGPVYSADAVKTNFSFKFRDGADNVYEHPRLEKEFKPYGKISGPGIMDEIWCKADKPFIYPMLPQAVEPESAPDYLNRLGCRSDYFVPSTGSLSGLGAIKLNDGKILFGLYHPNAAKVYVRGSFNNWQRPGHDAPSPADFIEMKLYRGYFGEPNTWLAVTDKAKIGDQYEFCIFGGVQPDDRNRLLKDAKDPYARQLDADYSRNNCVIVDPAHAWTDAAWKTPDMSNLIIYELSIFGFTEGDPGISTDHQGKFKGVTDRIENGYFDDLGVTALSIMPLAEVPGMQGPNSLGYNPSLYFAIERDFGTPADLRELVDKAHAHGLAVILDMVFNHTSNDFNPLWRMIVEHPAELSGDGNDGGLYFQGETPWGNRVDTWKTDVQNMLIDACKMYIKEYHADGFRYDATQHDAWMSGSFLHRLAGELKTYKPDVLLIAENLPNQGDLNRNGFDGYAQWCDLFHDKLKAVLREGPFDGRDLNTTAQLGDIFYYCKSNFAAHTNNVINYIESHDETSTAFEVATNPALNNPSAKDRKGRLGLFAAMVAMGQPMLYMGGEFNPERDRNNVRFDWPEDLERHGFYQWTRRLIRLRKRYPGLKLYGYNPAEAGQFSWILAPWMPPAQGGGRKVIGWRATPNGSDHDNMIVLINFENHDVPVKLDMGATGIWVKLADIENVNDISPEGTNSAWDSAALKTESGWYDNFTLPSSSGFIYKWEAHV
jgi:1,4-alpha-glucan branching enzyme